MDFRTSLLRTNRGLHFKQLECKSGLKMSVQGSDFSYSQPRKAGLKGELYSEFEIGFPSEKVDKIMQYAEDKDSPTGTVYGYVPHELIQEVINDNGGLV